MLLRPRIKLICAICYALTISIHLIENLLSHHHHQTSRHTPNHALLHSYFVHYGLMIKLSILYNAHDKMVFYTHSVQRLSLAIFIFVCIYGEMSSMR